MTFLVCPAPPGSSNTLRGGTNPASVTFSPCLKRVRTALKQLYYRMDDVIVVNRAVQYDFTSPITFGLQYDDLLGIASN